MAWRSRTSPCGVPERSADAGADSSDSGGLPSGEVWWASSSGSPRRRERFPMALRLEPRTPDGKHSRTVGIQGDNESDYAASVAALGSRRETTLETPSSPIETP